jgi:hypothetical protein
MQQTATQSNRMSPLLLAAGVIIVLNLLDAMFTLVYTRSGLATEANPLMDQVLAASPVLFMLAKLSLVSLGVLVLWRWRERRTARFGLIGAAGAYAVLLVHHLSGVEHLSRIVG